MFRKLFITGGILAVLGTFLFGRDVVSYVFTGAGCIKDSVRDSVPVKFEFQRARNMIAAIDPEIHKNMLLIAKEEVEIERLRDHITRLTATVDKDRTQLTRLTKDLKEGDYRFVYAGRHYTQDQVKADLANRLKRVKMNDGTLVSLQKVLSARENRLVAARQKLEQTLALKHQAVVEVENLEARQKMVEVAQTASQLSVAFDESQVSRTRDLLDQLATRIQVAERLVDSEGEFQDEIPLEEEAPANILEDVAAYLNQGQPEVATVADLD